MSEDLTAEVTFTADDSQAVSAINRISEKIELAGGHMLEIGKRSVYASNQIDDLGKSFADLGSKDSAKLGKVTDKLIELGRAIDANADGVTDLRSEVLSLTGNELAKYGQALDRLQDQSLIDVVELEEARRLLANFGRELRDLDGLDFSELGNRLQDVEENLLGSVRNSNDLRNALGKVEQEGEDIRKVFSSGIEDKLKELTRQALKLDDGFAPAVARMAQLNRELREADVGQLKRITNEVRDLERELKDAVRAQNNLNNKGFGSGLQDGIRKLGRAKGAVLAVAAAGYTAVKAFEGGLGLVNLASGIVEQTNRIEVALGNTGRQITSFARTSASDFGLSESAALQYGATFGDILQTLGVAEQEASKFSVNLLQRTADVASIKDLGIEEVLGKITAALGGEFEGLKRIGIAINQNTLERLAMTRGITKQELATDQALRATLVYEEFIRATNFAVGDFANTSDEFANRQRYLGAQFENLSAELGEKLLPAYDRLLTIGLKLADSPYFDAITQGLEDLIGVRQETEKLVTLQDEAFAAGIGQDDLARINQFQETFARNAEEEISIANRLKKEGVRGLFSGDLLKAAAGNINDGAGTQRFIDGIFTRKVPVTLDLKIEDKLLATNFIAIFSEQVQDAVNEQGSLFTLDSSFFPEEGFDLFEDMLQEAGYSYQEWERAIGAGDGSIKDITSNFYSAVEENSALTKEQIEGVIQNYNLMTFAANHAQETIDGLDLAPPRGIGATLDLLAELTPASANVDLSAVGGQLDTIEQGAIDSRRELDSLLDIFDRLNGYNRNLIDDEIAAADAAIAVQEAFGFDDSDEKKVVQATDIDANIRNLERELDVKRQIAEASAPVKSLIDRRLVGVTDTFEAEFIIQTTIDETTGGLPGANKAIFEYITGLREPEKVRVIANVETDLAGDLPAGLGKEQRDALLSNLALKPKVLSILADFNVDDEQTAAQIAFIGGLTSESQFEAFINVQKSAGADPAMIRLLEEQAENVVDVPLNLKLGPGNGGGPAQAFLTGEQIEMNVAIQQRGETPAVLEQWLALSPVERRTLEADIVIEQQKLQEFNELANFFKLNPKFKIDVTDENDTVANNSRRILELYDDLVDLEAQSEIDIQIEALYESGQVDAEMVNLTNYIAEKEFSTPLQADLFVDPNAPVAGASLLRIPVEVIPTYNIFGGQNPPTNTVASSPSIRSVEAAAALAAANGTALQIPGFTQETSGKQSGGAGGEGSSVGAFKGTGIANQLNFYGANIGEVEDLLDERGVFDANSTYASWGA